VTADLDGGSRSIQVRGHPTRPYGVPLTTFGHLRPRHTTDRAVKNYMWFMREVCMGLPEVAYLQRVKVPKRSSNSE
jgi:hypothetical protein